MLPDREAFDVFEHKGLCIQLGNNADEFQDETIAGIVKDALPNHREALARRSTEHTIDRTIANARRQPYFSGRKSCHRPRNNGRVREIVFVNGTMNGIYFDRCDNIETSLFKP